MMEQEQHDKLLFILDRCNDAQRDISHIKQLMYLLHVGFCNNGLEENGYGASITYLIDKLLEMIEKEYLEPLEKTLCEIGDFK